LTVRTIICAVGNQRAAQFVDLDRTGDQVRRDLSRDAEEQIGTARAGSA
jgi:hypothetical protein